jgi:hypothetical protein
MTGGSDTINRQEQCEKAAFIKKLRRIKMKKQTLIIPLALLLAAIIWSCQQHGSAPLSPEESITLAKKGGNGGGKGKGEITNFDVDITVGDAVFTQADAPLVSTCPGSAKSDGYHVSFGHTQCLIVKPKWTSSTYGPYELTDDISLHIK